MGSRTWVGVVRLEFVTRSFSSDHFEPAFYGVSFAMDFAPRRDQTPRGSAKISKDSVRVVLLDEGEGSAGAGNQERAYAQDNGGRNRA